MSTSPTGLGAEKLGSTQRVFNRTPAGEAVGMNHTYYFATDHQNSVVGVFDHNGTWYGGYSYSPYGEHRFTGANPILDTINLRYISGYSDDSAGLYRLGARYYDASLGRFTQYDPSGQEANSYSYAGCNPIGASDPSGLPSCSGILGLIGIGYAVIWGLALGASGFTFGVSVAVGAVVGLAWWALGEFGCARAGS
ncbi:MAG: RHS repeat-associated core domain-containing protein [Homoserinimonas sp.]